MSLIKSLHHVCMKCCDEKKFEEVIHFYKEILGLDVLRTWNAGITFQTGAGIIEVFNNANDMPETGTIRHFALATDDVDACAEIVRNAGYEVIIEPKNVDIPSDPVFPVRIAFVRGPLGEEIEFFCER